VPSDDVEAVKWYRRAAEQGVAAARRSRAGASMVIFKSFRQVRLLRSAAHKFHSGDVDAAIDEIYKYYDTEPAIYAAILSRFHATKDDIRSIMMNLAAAGGGTYRGHFVPVSAVIYPMTLSYMLRTLCGQVEVADAYYAVDEFFRTGALVLQAEKRILDAERVASR
jgi:TPR repeat protein